MEAPPIQKKRCLTNTERLRLRVRNLTNTEETLSLLNHKYAVPRNFDHVTRATTIKEVFEAVSRALLWPCAFMQLVIGDKAYDFPRLLRKQMDLKTFVMSEISSSGCEELSDSNHEITVFYFRWMPTDFRVPESQGYCFCNFGGCCKQCNVPSNQVCWACGNTGCCRSGNCSCDNCHVEFKDFQTQGRCPILGCRPWWAEQ